MKIITLDVSFLAESAMPVLLIKMVTFTMLLLLSWGSVSNIHSVYNLGCNIKGK
jgi:hypothetical protein